MSRTRIVKGVYTKITKGNYNMYSAGDTNITALGKNNFKGDNNTIYGNNPEKAPVTPIKSNVIIEAEWQNHLGNKISRAICGQKVSLLIKIDKQKLSAWGEGEYAIQFQLYHKNIKDKEADFSLIKTDTKQPYNEELIKNNETAKIEFSLNREYFDNRFDKDEEKMYNLFIKCQVIKKSDSSTVDLPVKLPHIEDQYLKMGDIVIDRYKMPGINLDGTDIADDMTYGYGGDISLPIYKDLQIYKEEYIENGFNLDKHKEYANRTPYLKPKYTTKEIRDLGKLIRYSDNIDNENMLWLDFKDMTTYLSRGVLEDNILMMIEKMKENQGGIYENSDLTQAIINNPATDNYCKKVEEYIIDKVRSKSDKLEEIEDKEPYFFIKKSLYNLTKKRNKNFRSPAYTWKENWNVTNGETIALNDIWATEVFLKELNFVEDEIKGKYQVILWDHFGLDKPDLERFYSYGAGFRAWFILQHRYGYRPFLTKIVFEKEFTSKNFPQQEYQLDEAIKNEIKYLENNVNINDIKW